MIIDASALLAVVLGEADAETYARAISNAAHRRLPSVTWFEASMRVDHAGDEIAKARFDDFINDFNIQLVAVAEAHVREARRARRQYGRPLHPAGLNFGDCLVYGVAKVLGEPLLFKGNDFAQTDIEPALPPE